MSTLQKEIFRKLVHLFQLPILLLYTVVTHYFSHRVGLLSLTGLLLLLLEIEFFRVDYTTQVGTRVTDYLKDLILRKHEKKNIVSAVFFIISAIICFSVFDYPIALSALLLTVFGDLAAAIVGTAVGGPKLFRDKTVAGTFAGFVVNCVVTFFLLGHAPFLAIAMALTASFVEMLSKRLDDNLTVPLFAGFVGQMILIFSR